MATYHEMRKRGMRVVVGGDYGFTVTPMGQNARDIGHFVKFFGYSPAEALRCATAVGGELMGHKGELGVIRRGRTGRHPPRRRQPARGPVDPRRPRPFLDDHEGRRDAPRPAHPWRGSAAGSRRNRQAGGLRERLAEVEPGPPATRRRDGRRPPRVEAGCRSRCCRCRGTPPLQYAPRRSRRHCGRTRLPPRHGLADLSFLFVPSCRARSGRADRRRLRRRRSSPPGIRSTGAAAPASSLPFAGDLGHNPPATDPPRLDECTTSA